MKKKSNGPTEVPPPSAPPIADPHNAAPVVLPEAAPGDTTPATLDTQIHIDRGRWSRLQDLRESSLVAHARYNAAAADAKEKRKLAEEADAAFNRAFDQLNAPPASLPLLDGLPPQGQADKNAEMLAQPWVKQILEDLKGLPDACPIRVVDWDARALEVAGWTKEYRSFVSLYVEQYKRWANPDNANSTMDNMPSPPAFLLPTDTSHPDAPRDELVDCHQCAGTGKIADPLAEIGQTGEPVTCPVCQGDGTIIVPEAGSVATANEMPADMGLRAAREQDAREYDEPPSETPRTSTD